jgi:hypothetical protein
MVPSFGELSGARSMACPFRNSNFPHSWRYLQPLG